MPLPLLHWLYSSGLPKFFHRDSHGNSPWTLVTGASDGIGRALSAELGARGFNVVLHGRSEAKLSNVRKDLETAYPQREFRHITADASAFTPADIERIASTLR